MSTGRRIERLTSSIRSTNRSPAPMPPTMPAEAISTRWGRTGLLGSVGGSISV
jgi:hypothetical protein